LKTEFPSHHATFYNGKGSQRWIGNFKVDEPGAWGKKMGSRGKALVRGLGDKVPQKLKQNGKLVHNY